MVDDLEISKTKILQWEEDKRVWYFLYPSCRKAAKYCHKIQTFVQSNFLFSTGCIVRRLTNDPVDSTFLPLPKDSQSCKKMRKVERNEKIGHAG